jgi:hypothetical protein
VVLPLILRSHKEEGWDADIVLNMGGPGEIPLEPPVAINSGRGGAEAARAGPAFGPGADLPLRTSTAVRFSEL